jgi:hypothetical protein
MSCEDAKPRLIILSDMWGREQSWWMDYYLVHLRTVFEIIYYDCCELGEIDITACSENQLHHQFINGGMQRAVSNLLQKEKGRVVVLAFSMGGVIAWKACLAGLDAESLFAVSATRLRYETEKPTTVIELFYGENDRYKPDNNWFLELNIERRVLAEMDHVLYQETDFATMLSERIVSLPTKER